jgi:hypothetical protein
MRRSLAGALVLAGGGLAASCGKDPASFVGLEIWESRPGGVLGGQVVQAADGSFPLRRDAQYVALVTVRSSGSADRCLFRPFSYSWHVPDRQFECHPEVQDGPMTIRVPFSTWSSDLARVSEYSVFAQVLEYYVDRRRSVAPPDERQYPVRFVQ